MDDIYKNIEEYNPNKEHKILIVFDDIIADVFNNNKFNPVVTKLSVRGIYLVFITQSYFAVPKNIILISTHLFYYNHSSDISFQEFMNLYKRFTEKSYIMAIDHKIRDEKLKYVLTERMQKYRHYHQAKLINMSILQVK